MTTGIEGLNVTEDENKKLLSLQDGADQTSDLIGEYENDEADEERSNNLGVILNAITETLEYIDKLINLENEKEKGSEDFISYLLRIQTQMKLDYEKIFSLTDTDKESTETSGIGAGASDNHFIYNFDMETRNKKNNSRKI